MAIVSLLQLFLYETSDEVCRLYVAPYQWLMKTSTTHAGLRVFGVYCCWKLQVIYTGVSIMECIRPDILATFSRFFIFTWIPSWFASIWAETLRWTTCRKNEHRLLHSISKKRCRFGRRILRLQLHRRATQMIVSSVKRFILELVSKTSEILPILAHAKNRRDFWLFDKSSKINIFTHEIIIWAALQGCFNRIIRFPDWQRFVKFPLGSKPRFFEKMPKYVEKWPK